MYRAHWTLALFLLAVTLSAWSRQDDRRTPEGSKAGQSVEGDVATGLIAEYYVVGHKMDKVPDFTQMKPTTRRIDDQIDFGSMKGTTKGWPDPSLKNYFAVRWMGMIRIPEDGSYTFYLKSDDGSRLWLDGKILIDHEGKYATDEASKTASLKGGTHHFRVDYFQNEEIAACQVSWEGGGMKKQIIPASAFCHRKDMEKAKEPEPKK